MLAALYESFGDPLIILLTVPMALMGALIGLQLRGLPLDVYGQMGLLVLVSLAAKNGILIVEFANQRRTAGLALQEAILEAAVNRMRPILLTAVTSPGRIPASAPGQRRAALPVASASARSCSAGCWCPRAVPVRGATGVPAAEALESDMSATRPTARKRRLILHAGTHKTASSGHPVPVAPQRSASGTAADHLPVPRTERGISNSS